MALSRHIRLCWEGIYYALVTAAILAGAVSRQLNLLMLLGCLLSGPLLFSLVYGRMALRRLTALRKLPGQLRADERLVVDVALTNSRRWLGAWAVELQDAVEREEGAASAAERVGARVFFPRIAAQETRQATYEGRLPRRGRYRFGPLHIATRFPLGLIRHSVLLDQSETLLVHPRIGRLTHEWAHVLRENSAGSERMPRRGQMEADFYGLRDWRSGDSRRSIHWRSSARRGSLVVRQFEERRSQDLALLVDLWQPAQATEKDLEHVEMAVSFVATVIADACRQPGRHLTLNLSAQETLARSGPASAPFFREQMDSLSLVAAHQLPHFPRALGHALALIPPSMPVLLISTRAVDWDALTSAAAERDAQVAGRTLWAVDVGSGELARFFHD